MKQGEIAITRADGEFEGQEVLLNRVRNGQTRTWSQAEIDQLNPAVFGVGSLERDDGVKFWCDGASFTEVVGGGGTLSPEDQQIIDDTASGKLVSVTSAQKDALDATTWGDSPLLVTGVAGYAYIQYISDGTDFVETFRVTDTGELVGEIVPRVDTLEGLELTLGNAGELASASDQAAIMQFKGGGEAGGSVFRQGSSYKKIVTGLPTLQVVIDTDYILIDFTSSGQVITLKNGYMEGQLLSIQGNGLVSGPINSVSVGGTNYTLVGLNLLGKGSVVSFVFTEGAWVNIATLPSVVKNRGITNFAVNPSSSSIALGDCKNFGDNSVVVGVNSLSSGNNCYNSSIGGDSEERFDSNFASFSNVTSATLTENTITVVASGFLGSELTVGDKVTLSNDWYHLDFYHGEVTAVAVGSFGVLVADKDLVKFSGTWLRVIPYGNNNSPRYSESRGLAPYITTEGQAAVGWAGHASNTLSSGGSQTTETRFVARTVDSSPTVMLSNIDNSPASWSILFITSTPLTSSLDFRTFLTKAGKAYAIEATIFAKSAGSTTPDLAVFKRSFAVFNNAGVQSITAINTDGTDIKTGGLSGLSSPTFTVNDTDQTLEVTATGIAATTIGWMCELKALEIKMVN